jgi:hypothetical protein
MVATAIVTAEPDVHADQFRPELLRVFDGLPLSQQKEVLDFARFLRQQMKTNESAITAPLPQIELRTAPTTTLVGLTGLVHMGGDALADTEALYDNDTGCH